ncbi:methyltransferase family protein [Sporolactobacillus pectinivorans]|uniref:methyltransferase family protein n=1 Tax=Sporolactobacillus pectinivorans TaxID=1591408 RepID=UPI000C2646EE|nr:methyltransferase [Sporolactobacillus pectinivorans]
MNAFLTVIPIILIRFGLLNILDKRALKRAAYFPPLIGGEKVAFWFYQIANILILLYLLFLRIRNDSFWYYAGLIIYSLGIILCIISVVDFAKPNKNGINLKGLYRMSRNPMYVAYFIYFLGCVLLTRSLILLTLLVIFQISTHWIILSEERWCTKEFDGEYVKYMHRVRRYF